MSISDISPFNATFERMLTGDKDDNSDNNLQNNMQKLELEKLIKNAKERFKSECEMIFLQTQLDSFYAGK